MNDFQSQACMQNNCPQFSVSPPTPPPPPPQSFTGTCRFWGAPQSMFELVRSLADTNGVSIKYTRIGSEGFIFKNHYGEFQATGTPEAYRRFHRDFESIHLC